MKVFIDSNVPMYVAGRDHPLRDPCRRFLARDTDRARDLVRRGTPASMRDLVHAAVMLNNEVRQVASSTLASTA